MGGGRGVVFFGGGEWLRMGSLLGRLEAVFEDLTCRMVIFLCRSHICR